MSDISEVIGWKFNHQEGMITKDGVITEFPGGVPAQADQDLWTKEYMAKAIPLMAWTKKMEVLDEIPRWAEDLFDAMNASDKANVDQHTKNKFDAKKAHRLKRPK